MVDGRCCEEGETWAPVDGRCCAGNVSEGHCCDAGLGWASAEGRCCENPQGGHCCPAGQGWASADGRCCANPQNGHCCPSGTVITAPSENSEPISGLGDGYNCYCSQSEQHYTTSSYQSVPWGTAGASCKACPNGSTWNGSQCSCGTSSNGIQLTMTNNSCQCGSNYDTTVLSNNQIVCCPTGQSWASIGSMCCPADRFHGTECCPEDTHWDASISKCARCQYPETQIYVNGQCQDCPSLQEVDTYYTNWSNTYNAYTVCKCFVGSLTGQGGVIKYGGADTECRCENSGEYYTNSNYELVPYNATAGYSCKRCPAGSTWNGEKCVCQNGFSMVGTPKQCNCLSPNTAFNTQTLAACSAGDANCICAACPSNTCPLAGGGCQCQALYFNHNIGNNMHLSFVPGSQTYGYEIYNTAGSYGYCIFSCNSGEYILDDGNTMYCATCQNQTAPDVVENCGHHLNSTRGPAGSTSGTCGIEGGSDKEEDDNTGTISGKETEHGGTVTVVPGGTVSGRTGNNSGGGGKKPGTTLPEVGR